MRRHLISISVVGSAALAACFGSGPVPQKSQATVIATAPGIPSSGDVCNDSRYLSTVVIGNDPNVYGLFEPFTPPNSNGCNGGTTMSFPVDVMSFDKSGTTLQGMDVGPAGQSNTVTPPRITTGNGTVYWSYSNTVQSGQIQANINPGSGGGFSATGIVAGAARLFMLGYGNTGGFAEEPWNPQWPCCGNNNQGSNAGELISVPLPLVQGSLTPQLITETSMHCEELKECLVGNGGELYFMAGGDIAMGTVAVIQRFSKLDSTVTMLDEIPTQLSSIAIPVGLAATETHVAWAVANSGSTNNSQIQPGCWIYGRTLSDPPPGRLLFQTGKFSCLDVALDDSYAYFAIVHSSSQNDCSGCQQPIHGDGIGRVPLDGSMTLESIDLHMQGLFSGPRRVFLDPDGVTMYVADPIVMAKMPRDALSMKQEIAP